eukprot:6582908-Prymnesium_polylepis.1
MRRPRPWSMRHAQSQRRRIRAPGVCCAACGVKTSVDERNGPPVGSESYGMHNGASSLVRAQMNKPLPRSLCHTPCGKCAQARRRTREVWLGMVARRRPAAARTGRRRPYACAPRAASLR